MAEDVAFEEAAVAGEGEPDDVRAVIGHIDALLGPDAEGKDCQEQRDVLYELFRKDHKTMFFCGLLSSLRSQCLPLGVTSPLSSHALLKIGHRLSPRGRVADEGYSWRPSKKATDILRAVPENMRLTLLRVAGLVAQKLDLEIADPGDPLVPFKYWEQASPLFPADVGKLDELPDYMQFPGNEFASVQVRSAAYSAAANALRRMHCIMY